MATKPHYETLWCLYIEQKLSSRKIGQEFGVSHHTVSAWLRDYDIPIRSKSETAIATHGGGISRDLLVSLYIDQHLSIHEIANQLDFSATKVWSWLKKHRIPLRPSAFTPNASKPTPKELEEMYLKQELSLQEIAQKVGAHDGKTIYTWLKEAGIPIRSRQKAYQNALEHGKDMYRWKTGDAPTLGHKMPESVRKAQSEHQKIVFASPEKRHQMSEMNKGKTKSDTHRKNISKGRTGIQFSASHRENIRQATLRQKPTYFDTAIEIIIQKALIERGISFDTHVCIANICRPDIIFTQQKLAIFCDGDYWHNLPHVFDRDRRQEIEMTKQGWRYLRFWEHEIHSTPERCIEAIIQALTYRLPPTTHKA